MSQHFQGCGIAGCYVFNSNEGKQKETLSNIDVESMVEKLKHRGPDGNHIWRKDGVVFGHTRLSILDLSENGKQPMTRDHLTLTYNGEIYNFLEIKQTLVEKGYTFSTGTDTEVLLRSFQEWGIECVNKFNGFFAFAIWDDKEKKLYLSLDRLGIKPLFYYFSEDAILFSSEVESLMASYYIPTELDWNTAMDFICCCSFADLDKTPVKGVLGVPPGHYMVVSSDGTHKIEKYWDIPFSDETYVNYTTEQLTDEFQKLFENSVNLRFTRSDVPVSIFLSGGLDSSTCCAVATKSSNQKIRFFTIDHPEGDCEDLRFSKIVADSLEGKGELSLVPSLPVKITVEAINELLDLSCMIDEMRQISIYQNYKAIRDNGFKVVLNSQGADEIMGGYVGLPNFYNSVLDVRTGEMIFHKVFETSIHSDNITESAINHLIDYQKRTSQRFKDICGKATGLEAVSRWLVKNSLRRFLKFEDFLSMKNSVECRVPFLDHNIVEFCFKVPFDKHIIKEERRGKILLKNVVERLLPEEVANRPKQPFPFPNMDSVREDVILIIKENFNDIKKCSMVNKNYKIENILDNFDKFQYQELWDVVALWLWEERFYKYGPQNKKPKTFT
eukprot:TRINITY_DN11223_c0_g1_i1.p1 TRINITY_DN11223_c0_g1~~TRINITY_DN11223_c0_g1_i1.p1  ORF type:complete len:613 (+),score=95.85 TRINITY_DN11223_c0_g1_i1:53-1891(+)